MNGVFYMKVDSPVGQLELSGDEKGILGLRFCGPDSKPAQEEKEIPPVLLQASQELEEYFEGRRTCFTVPLFPKGTEFQKKVWKALCGIPYGETRTYGEIAAAVGNPKACRAVGMANHDNPICIFIPCHRVIGKNGALTGFGGGLDKKEILLNLEKRGKKEG